MRTENIENQGVDIEVNGIYVENVEAVTYPVDNAMPGSPSDFEVLSIMFEGVDVLPIYSSLDKVDDIIELVIKKIEDI
jgi:hypothetical protein